MYNCTSSFMSNMCYLWLQSFYMYFTSSLKIYHTFTYMYKFQCMLCVLTFDKSATLSMASWSLTIQTYSLPKITKQEGKHHYSWQCSVYVLYKVQNLYSCGMSEYNSTVHVHALSLNWKKKCKSVPVLSQIFAFSTHPNIRSCNLASGRNCSIEINLKIIF